MSLDHSYEVYHESGFEKSIKKNLPLVSRKVLDKKIGYLKCNPGHPSLNTKPYCVSEQTLKRLGVDEVYEFYINLSFRCIFYVIHRERQIILAFVGNHEQLRNRYT